MKKSCKYTFQSGFTLVELLVVIGILGLLAVGLIAAINPTAKLAQSRDARRKADLRQIYQALEDYYTQYGSYPAPNPGTCDVGSNCYVFSTAGTSWISELVNKKMLKSVPVDPINNATGPWTVATNNYSYAYGNVSATGEYDLVALLENPNDPDRCGLKDYIKSIILANTHWCQAFGGVYNNQLYERSPKNLQ